MTSRDEQFSVVEFPDGLDAGAFQMALIRSEAQSPGLMPGTIWQGALTDEPECYRLYLDDAALQVATDAGLRPTVVTRIPADALPQTKVLFIGGRTAN